MPLKVSIPLDCVQAALSSSLVLDHPQRCSRCGAVPADLYETHSLRLRIGRKRPGLYRQTYRVNQSYNLKIRVCETCYRSDFVTSIEDQEKDDTATGRMARLYNRAYTIGGVIACTGMLLMTNIVSPGSALGGVKTYWPYLVGAGGFIILAAWLHQRYRMRRMIEELEAAGITIESRPRARVRTPVLDDENDSKAVALEISIHDETWAAECAAHYDLRTEVSTTGFYQGEE